MCKDVKDAGDRLMLWYYGLKPRDKQVVDSNGSVAHLLERRRELTSRLASVDRELAAFLAERLTDTPPDLRPPLDCVLRPLNAALGSLIARGEIHGAKTDRLTDAIRQVKAYAVEVIGYPIAFADGVFDNALERLARARAERQATEYAREDERYRARAKPAAAARRRRK